MRTKWKMLVLLAVIASTSLAVSGSVQRSRRAPRGLAVAAVQQAADSVQVEVSWTAPVIGAGWVAGYTLRGTGPGWLIERTTTSVADTLWLPKDTVAVTADVCVNAFGQGSVGDAACAQYVIPAKVVIGPPGTPVVKATGGLASIIDSIGVLLPDTVFFDPAAPIAYTPALVGWTDDGLPAPILVTCGQMPDGRVGWAEVEPWGDWIRPRQPGLFREDATCGWTVESLDPTLLALTPPDGPYVFSVADVAVGASFVLAQTHYDVLISATDVPSGGSIPSVGRVVTITLLSGAWGNGATDARTCTTDSAGTCGPGRVTPGARLRLDVDRAVPVEVVAPTSHGSII